MIDLDTIIAEIIKEFGFGVVFKDISEVSEEEFALIRMEWFGASDSSKLLNVNPFPNGTIEDLIKEKVTGVTDESIGKKASVRMGKEIEELILAKAEKMLDPMLDKEGSFFYLIKPMHMYGNYDSHLSINFDGIAIVTPRDSKSFIYPVEAKAVTKYGRKHYDFNKSFIRTKDGEIETKIQEIGTYNPVGVTSIQDYCIQAADYYGIPVYYYTQLQQQIMAIGSNFGYLAVLDVDNWDMHIFKVYKSPLVHNALKNKAKEAWAIVETKKAIRNNKDTKEIDTDI